MAVPQRVTEKIVCPHCGQTGLIGWENTETPETSVHARVLVSVSNGFFRSIDGVNSESHQIVCDRCGFVLRISGPDTKS